MAKELLFVPFGAMREEFFKSSERYVAVGTAELRVSSELRNFLFEFGPTTEIWSWLTCDIETLRNELAVRRPITSVGQSNDLRENVQKIIRDQRFQLSLSFRAFHNPAFNPRITK
jgi:hypothetical protein